MLYREKISAIRLIEKVIYEYTAVNPLHLDHTGEEHLLTLLTTIQGWFHEDLLHGRGLR